MPEESIVGSRIFGYELSANQLEGFPEDISYVLNLDVKKVRGKMKAVKFLIPGRVRSLEIIVNGTAHKSLAEWDEGLKTTVTFQDEVYVLDFKIVGEYEHPFPPIGENHRLVIGPKSK
ncbi:hypothetical protein HY448_01520 [Candidatus Pacearchaeota archaeon]|nr:hypothetical protein [Candidatus Pacearchaeota archaeon]